MAYAWLVLQKFRHEKLDGQDLENAKTHDDACLGAHNARNTRQVCAHIFLYICIYAHTYAHTYMHACIQIHIFVHFTSLHLSLSKYSYTSLSVSLYTSLFRASLERTCGTPRSSRWSARNHDLAVAISQALRHAVLESASHVRFVLCARAHFRKPVACGTRSRRQHYA